MREYYFQSSAEQKVKTKEEENKEKNIASPIRNHPASLHDIFTKAESLMERLSVGDEKIRKIEECT